MHNRHESITKLLYEKVVMRTIIVIVGLLFFIIV